MVLTSECPNSSCTSWGLDKGSIADQSAISLIIRTTGICWNQVVCKGMAGKQRLCLKMKNLSETEQSNNINITI